MKIVADENIDRRLIDRLRGSNIEVLSIREREPSSKDTHVLFLSNLSDALLITEDKDFGELVFHRRQSHFGVLLIRLSGISRTQQVELAYTTIMKHREELMRSFSVLKPNSLRIRPAIEERGGK